MTAGTVASEGTEWSESSAIAEVLASGGVRSMFQPIVNIATGDVVAYEALARGPLGPLESPLALFGAARRCGLLAELDDACRTAAIRGASDRELLDPLTIFVNVEPEVVENAAFTDLVAILDAAPGDLRVVLEITERALASRPAELLRTVERVRALGWGIALDDVGVDPTSLAFMSLLRPDVVKLDLSLVQGRPSPEIAGVMNAVNAYAERSGALLLAEGIEDARHVTTALALGATLGQGWFYGRPTFTPTPQPTALPLSLPSADRRVPPEGLTSPFTCLPDEVVLRRAPKRLLIELSKQLERQAMQLGKTCVIASTFQFRRHFTSATALRYRDLVDRTGFVCALGEGVPAEPMPGLRGGELQPDDALLGEWDVVVLSPHFSSALLARDLGDTGPDMERVFEYALTYTRDVVQKAARQMLLRVGPSRHRAAPQAYSSPSSVAPTARTLSTTELLPDTVTDALVRRALAASINGVTISDMTRPDQPMMFINNAFERLAGFPAADLVDRNCRLLQGADTDQAAVARIRAAIAAGEECKELLLNYRGPQREPWWNEIHLSPVTNAEGRVVQYIGVQNDVSDRVQAQRDLIRERDRGAVYLARIEQLASTDSLTGLMNRRRFEDRFEAALLSARMQEQAVALLFMDLDGFKAVNDTHGHAAGDELLRTVARRLRDRVRASDLLARMGGDEFLVGLAGLDPRNAQLEVAAVAEQLRSSVSAPVELSTGEVRVGVSIGVSICPDDAEDFGPLFHVAELRMYDLKHPAAPRI